MKDSRIYAFFLAFVMVSLWNFMLTYCEVKKISDQNKVYLQDDYLAR